ncbi:MAG TPA: hypothetical protein DCX07_11065 [Phycisphaerales bacterium]|nr:hypothetical protein [Phycisphaerales bacterium]
MNASCDILALAPLAFDWTDGVISVGLFASIVLLVVSVFNQPGAIQLSPQREAAIATGHTDRKTVFENPYLRPLLWLLLALSSRLAMPRAKQWLNRTLVAAGSPNYYTAEEYLALSFLTGLVLAALLEVTYLLVYGTFSATASALGLAAGIFLTIHQIYETASKRLQAISQRLPYALDLIALAMGAGATFTEAVQTIVRERNDDPFNVELKTLLAEMELGTTRRKALQNLAARVPLDHLQSIVASVIQSEELGTPLADVLHSQATLLRLQRTVRAENLAAVASVRILVPCLLLLFAVILAVFGPAIIRALQGGLF